MPPDQQRRAPMHEIPPPPDVETDGVLVVDIPDGSLFNDFNMTGEEEISIGDADMTGPEGDEEDQLTKVNTQDTEETSESEEEKEDEDRRSWRFRSERQTDTNASNSSGTRDIPDTLATATVPQQQVAPHQGPPPQQQQPYQINDIVEDEEENVNDTGLTDEQNNNLDEEVGMEEEELNKQVDTPEVDDLNMAGENQSFASQPSMTAPISSTPLTTTKSEKPKPSTTSEEETSMVDADITGPEEDKEEDTENDQEQLTVNGATCEQELNMTDKSATRKRRSAEAALDKDDELLQDESPTKKIKHIVEDEDALLGDSDGEENLNDPGLTDEQNNNLEEEVGLEEEEDGEDRAGLPDELVDSADTTGPEEDEEEDQKLLLYSQVPEMMNVAYRVKNARKVFLCLKVPVGSKTAYTLQGSTRSKLQIQLVSGNTTENDLGVSLYVRFPQRMILSFSLQSSRMSNGEIKLVRKG